MPLQPTVAIVGRPNVGKSTLFNRLTRTRSALVSDFPGLTRDRREGAADLGPAIITLIDTAGLEEAAPGTIADRTRRQTEAAVNAADLILFVIDGRAGVTPADEAFARLVRASGRPVVLAANKCEGHAGEEGFYDAFSLGFGTPVAVSAEHGEGISDLVAELLEALGVQRGPAGGSEIGGRFPDNDPKPVRVAIVGRPNTGKSTLVNALLKEDRMLTGPEPGLTRDAIATNFLWGGHAVRLFDTAGLRRKARVVERTEQLSNSDAVRAVRFADVVVLLMDVERPFEHQDLTIAGLAAREGRALVVAINKWDLVSDKQRRLRHLQDMAMARLSDVSGVTVVPISALAETGLDRLMEAVFAAHRVWTTRVPTPDLNRWLQEALALHAPPAVHGRRVKLRYVTQTSTRPPTLVLFCSRPRDLPKSYLRYLTNSLRDAFSLPGVPMRLHLRKGENPYADTKERR